MIFNWFAMVEQLDEFKSGPNSSSVVTMKVKLLNIGLGEVFGGECFCLNLKFKRCCLLDYLTQKLTLFFNCDRKSVVIVGSSFGANRIENWHEMLP